MKSDNTYWITLAHLPKWGFGKINNLVIKFFHEEKISIEEFFNLQESVWSSRYELNSKDISDLQTAKSELPANAFLVENLLNQGYQLVPITSPEYSKTLKQNLKIAHSPTLLYLKGNSQIIQEKSIAIVGSRAAEEKSLGFTDNIAQMASKNHKVVVSGFAKGVDKQALDSTLRFQGQSIIVLPQGIATFNSGFKTYYKQIVDGNVLVLSTFHPNAGWSAGLAMARNPIIYGLADEIFVAESGDKGGTWSGVIDGLRKGRKIFVRIPEPDEKNANELLIQKGAIPVDSNGVCMEHISPFSINEPTFSIEKINDKIIKSFKGKPLSIKDILEKSELEWSAKKLSDHLKQMKEIQLIKNGKINQYTLASVQYEQSTLF